MTINEQGFWRLIIAAGIGLGAAAIALVIDTLRKDPKVPVAAGLAAAGTAYAIDWYTERKGA